MSNSNNSGGSAGLGFLDALCLLFIGLKLGGVIGWSWWWVLFPLWIQGIILIPILLIFLVVLWSDR